MLSEENRKFFREIKDELEKLDEKKIPPFFYYSKDIGLFICFSELKIIDGEYRWVSENKKSAVFPLDKDIASHFARLSFFIKEPEERFRQLSEWLDEQLSTNKRENS